MIVKANLDVAARNETKHPGCGGVKYNFDREIYVNRSARKIFSIDFIEDNDAAEIEMRIRQETDKREWKFYCNVEPSDYVKREIARVLG